MLITLKDTVEHARTSAPDAVRHPTLDGAPVMPFNAGTRGGRMTCHYRLANGKTYDVADDMGEQLVSTDHAEPA